MNAEDQFPAAWVIGQVVAHSIDRFGQEASRKMAMSVPHAGVHDDCRACRERARRWYPSGLPENVFTICQLVEMIPPCFFTPENSWEKLEGAILHRLQLPVERFKLEVIPHFFIEVRSR